VRFYTVHVLLFTLEYTKRPGQLAALPIPISYIKWRDGKRKRERIKRKRKRGKLRQNLNYSPPRNYVGNGACTGNL